MKKQLIYFMSILFFSMNSVYAQSYEKNSILDSNPIKQEIQKPQSSELKFNKINQQMILKLDSLIDNSQYQDFVEEIKKYRIEPNDYISYLNSKSPYGHIPIYWLIADYHAHNNNSFETHKWLYIATIMTQQDSYLCSDYTARNAPRILLKSFPKATEITRKTPHHIQNSMSEVFFFIHNIKQRIDPSWVCKYGQAGVNSNNNILIDKKLWKEKRQEVLRRFTDKYVN